MSDWVPELLRAADTEVPRGERMRHLARCFKRDAGFLGAFTRADSLGEFTVMLREEASERFDRARLGDVLCAELDPYQKPRGRQPGVPRQLTIPAASLGAPEDLVMLLLWDSQGASDVRGPNLLGGLLVEPGAPLLEDRDLYVSLQVIQLSLSRELFHERLEEYRAGLEMVNALLPPRLTGGAGMINRALAEFRRIIPFDAVALAISGEAETHQIRYLFPAGCGEGLMAAVRREMKDALGASEDEQVVEVFEPQELEGEWSQEDTMESLLVLPMIGARGEDCGRIGFFSGAAGFFTTHHLRLLGLLAPSVGLALQTVRGYEGLQSRAEVLEGEQARVEAQLELARRLQAQLLPRCPEPPPGLEVSGRSEMSAAIGGDFFAARRIGRHRYAVAVADVSGKGLPAGIVMAHTRGALWAAWDVNPEPLHVIRRMNRVVCESTDDYSFVTMALLLLDERSDEVVYCSAGHEPLLHLAGDGTLTQLTLGDPPLGILEDYEHTAGSFRLGPGERVVLYSDGVTDAASPAGERFLSERFHRLLAGGPAGVQGLLDAVFAGVEGFADGAPQRDDLTCLVIGRRSPPPDRV